jgi:hypothetical protein
MKIHTRLGVATIVDKPPRTARRIGTHKHEGVDYIIWREGGRRWLTRLVL